MLMTLHNNVSVMMMSYCEQFGAGNIGGFLSKPPIRQNKFPAKISGHTVLYLNVKILPFELISFNITTPCKLKCASHYFIQ